MEAQRRNAVHNYRARFKRPSFPDRPQYCRFRQSATQYKSRARLKRELFELPILASSRRGWDPFLALAPFSLFLAETVLAHDDVQPRRVLLVLGHFGEVETLEVGKHANDVRPVVGGILDRVAVQGDAVKVLEWGKMLEIRKPPDLVPVQVYHLQGSELEDVVTDLKQRSLKAISQ